MSLEERRRKWIQRVNIGKKSRLRYIAFPFILVILGFVFLYFGFLYVIGFLVDVILNE